MPQVILLALLGVGAYAGYRWLQRTTREVAAELRRTQEELRRRGSPPLERDLGNLEYDEKSGEYRPAKRR